MDFFLTFKIVDNVISKMFWSKRSLYQSGEFVHKYILYLLVRVTLFYSDFYGIHTTVISFPMLKKCSVEKR